MGHENEQKILIWVKKGMLEKFDEKLKEKNYKDRTEFIREKIREFINN